MGVIVALGKPEHIEESVKNGVEITAIRTSDPELREALNQNYPNGIMHVWGFKRPVKYIWDDAGQGDFVLFYHDRQFIYVGTVSFKYPFNPDDAQQMETSTDVATQIWGTDTDGETWKYLIFIKEVKEIDLDLVSFNQSTGYAFSALRKSMYLTDQKAGQLIHRLKKVYPTSSQQETLAQLEAQKRDNYVTELEQVSPAYFSEGVRNLCNEEPWFAPVIKNVVASLLAGKNIILYGPPGTSKTYLSKKICEVICGKDNFRIETANAEWSNYDIVGGYILKGGETQFKEGILLQAVKKCIESIQQYDKPYWLIIDELNRANLDLAFGKVFTQLDMEYRETPIVEDELGDIRIPLSFRIIATMNTYDRAILFSLGYAFIRRFALYSVKSILLTENQTYESLNIDPAILGQIETDTRLKEKISSAVKQHFTMKRDNDRSYLDESLKINDEQEIIRIFDSLRIGNKTILDLLVYVISKINSLKICEVGHAILFDAAKFIIAYYRLFRDEFTDARTGNQAMLDLLTSTISAYVLPHIEYFMPKLRRGLVLDEPKYRSSWEQLVELFNKLGLISIVEKLKMAPR